MFCAKCGKQLQENLNFCPNCGSKVNQSGESAIKPKNEVPQKPVKRKKKKPVLFILLLVIAAALLILFFAMSGRGSLDLGKTTAEVTEEISTEGGYIAIIDEDSAINGFRIRLKKDTYDKATTFEIKTTEIKGHKLGEEFSPVTPLITIDNGHEFADRPMEVMIPIEISKNEFAMGFYYDRKTGELEALPMVSYDETQITLLVNHFSEVVVSKISIADLEKISIGSDVSIDTGFEPGKDDWQFVNYGSALAPGGHCAGQSLTMAWYYFEKFQGDSEPRLSGRFDNNGQEKTEGFWEDDSDSYRFASVIQDSIDWNSQEFNDYLDFCRQNQRRVFYAFAYAMKVTGQPQFMGIFRYDDQGNIAGGHAIVAYKVEDGKVFVADPNYPGQTDRYCELGSNGFKPYSSGENAAEISEYGGVLYTEMHFIASSALIDFEDIKNNYEKMIDGTIGDNEFPGTEVGVLTSYDSDFTKSEFTPADETVTLDSEYTGNFADGEPVTALIRITPKAGGLYYSLYENGSQTPEQNPDLVIADGSLYYEVTLDEGLNNFAFLVEQEIDGGFSYVDFIRVNIEYGEKETPTTEPPEKNSGTANIILAFDDNINYNPAIVTYEYNVGDQFPMEFIESRTIAPSGYTFGGYYTDKELAKPLEYKTVPDEDVYVYIKWQKMSLDSMLGRYDSEKLEDYLDYHYLEFLPGGTCRTVYKYKDQTDETVGGGTWTYRETPYKDYSISSLDVNWDSDPFPRSYVVYFDSIRESGGKTFLRK